jgi:hypothetical protein
MCCLGIQLLAVLLCREDLIGYFVLFDAQFQSRANLEIDVATVVEIDVATVVKYEETYPQVHSRAAVFPLAVFSSKD